MTKKRVTLRLRDEEVALVANTALWQHVANTYREIATWEPEYSDEFLDIAIWIENEIKQHGTAD